MHLGAKKSLTSAVSASPQEASAEIQSVDWQESNPNTLGKKAIVQPLNPKEKHKRNVLPLKPLTFGHQIVLFNVDAVVFCQRSRIGNNFATLLLPSATPRTFPESGSPQERKKSNFFLDKLFFLICHF